MKTVKYTDWIQFLKDYGNGIYPWQRMGQAFMGKFEITDDEKLLYYLDRKTTIKYIQEKYIDFET